MKILILIIVALISVNFGNASVKPYLNCHNCLEDARFGLEVQHKDVYFNTYVDIDSRGKANSFGFSAKFPIK